VRPLFLLLLALAGCADLAQRADALTDALMPAAGGVAAASQIVYGGRPYIATDQPRPVTCIPVGNGAYRCQ
jgi:hypothetical protein